MTYSVDIAGFYYARSGIALSAPATVKEIMQEASRLDLIDRANNLDNPVLQFMVEGSRPAFLNTISVHHKVRAVSRQKGTTPIRSYPDGEYVFTDDPAIMTTDANGNQYFLATDLTGNPTGAPFLRTWQYYLYDRNGVDIGRANKIERTVEPFAGKVVPDGTTIVWRAVLIGVAPSWQAGQKSK